MNSHLKEDYWCNDKDNESINHCYQAVIWIDLLSFFKLNSLELLLLL